MSSRRAVLSKPRGTRTPGIPAQVASLTSLFATLTRQSQLSDSLDFETLYFDTLAQLSPVSPLSATLTRNTGGRGTPHTSLLATRRYLLTLFLPSTYTHFSFPTRVCVSNDW